MSWASMRQRWPPKTRAGEPWSRQCWRIWSVSPARHPIRERGASCSITGRPGPAPPVPTCRDPQAARLQLTGGACVWNPAVYPPRLSGSGTSLPGLSLGDVRGAAARMASRCLPRSVSLKSVPLSSIKASCFKRARWWDSISAVGIMPWAMRCSAVSSFGLSSNS